MIEADRIISSQVKMDEDVIDRAIRPKLLADYGDNHKCENRWIFLLKPQIASRCLRSSFDFRSSRFRKTTLANIVANEMGVNIRTTSGPVPEKAGDLAAMLTNPRTT